MSTEKDLNYWKANAEEDYMQVPISVLAYITELETAVKNCSIPDVVGSYDHCNIVDLASNKTILTTPANRFELKFMNVDKEVGKIQI